MNHGDGIPPRVIAEGGEISLVEIGNALLRNWRIVAGLPLAFAFLLGLWSLTQERMYVASASFLPEAPERRTAGGAAALAQQFGVAVSTDRPGQSPQFYVDLLRSQALLRQAVESEYPMGGRDGGEGHSTLIELYEVAEPRGTIPPWRRATQRLRSDIAPTITRETGVVRFTVAAFDAALAEHIATRLVELLNAFNTDVRQGRAQEEVRFIGSRLAEVQAELLAAETAMQEFLRQNRVWEGAPELRFEHDRLDHQVRMRQEIYTSLLRSQEQARIDAVRDTPLLTVIDHPIGTAEPQGRGTVVRVILAFIIGLVIAVLIALVAEFTRRGRAAGDPHYQELQGLAQQTWDEIRHPSSWVRRRRRPVAAGDG
jgi:uncharacterized protein involved in exopolysaccharide biosynthesis